MEKKEKSVAAKTQYDRCKSSILQEIVRARNILRGKLEQMGRANIIRNGNLAAKADNGDEALKCEIGVLEQFNNLKPLRVSPNFRKKLMLRINF